MFSVHSFGDISFSAEWREIAPQNWKIKRLHSSPTSSRDLPAELQVMLAKTDELFAAWYAGLIPKLPLDLLDYDSYNWSASKQSIMEALYDVPRGTVVTYKELGIRAGLGPNAARAVGNAMADNPWAFFYPCHRVVKAGYVLGNYSMIGPAVKERLLTQEGVIINNGICKI